MSTERALQNQLMQAAQVVESFVDAEISRLDQMDSEDLEAIRQNRLKEMKRMAGRKDEWLQIGHGQYQTLKDEKEFFDEQKKSERFICHFYRDSTFRCKIIDKHMEILARKHFESRFVRIDAEKSMWLCQKLHIRVLPTIALIKDQKAIDFILGFDDLGGVDDFPTEMLEWRLGTVDVINYSGEKPVLKSSNNASSILGYAGKSKKGVRVGGDGNDDDEDDDDDDD